MRGRAARCRYADAGGSRRRPACRHRAGVGRAACPRQRTRAAGRDSHVRGHGAHDAGRPPGRRHVRPAAGPRRLRQAARAAPPALRHGRRLPVPADLQRQALAQLLRPDRPAGTGRRSALSQPWRARRASARSTPSSPMSSATAPRTTGWPIWRAPTSRRPACTPSKTCWMTNTWPPPVSSARRTTHRRPPAHARAAGPLRRHAHRHPPPRPALGSTAANCWRKPVTTRPPSTPCSRAASPFLPIPGTPGTPDGL